MNNIEECKMVPITELLECIVDNRGKSCPTCDEGFPLIATNCIKHSSIYPTFENIRYVSDETLKTWFRAELKPNDILFVNKGTPGRVCLVPDPITFCAAQDMIGLRADSKKIYYKYLFAVLRSNFIQEKIANFHVGIAIPHFKKSDMDNLLIPVPDIYIQKKIGDMYCELSEKIENNNKINAELESMAKTIYDYWFLQFEFPNEDGKPYKSSGGKMVWNEELKSEIPEGWEVSDLSKYINVIRGVAYDTEDITNQETAGYIPLLKSNNLQNDRLILDDIVYVKKENVAEDQILENNSIFVTMSSGSTEHVGKTAIIFYDMPYTYGAFCSKIDIKPKYRGFISMFFLSDYFKKKIRTIVVGTSIKNINNSHLTGNTLAFPNEDILGKFEKIIAPIFDKEGEIIKENQELASLRDFLLPMLMNGQIGFKDGER